MSTSDSAGADREPRSLADELRTWDDEARLALLTLRPDLVTPAPRSSGQLAARATTLVSATRAVDLLDAWQLRVLRAVLDAPGVSPATLTRDLGPEAAPALVHLRELALVFGRDQVRPVSILAQGAIVATDAAPSAPPLAIGPADTALLARTAAGAAFEFVRRTEQLLDRWGTHPPGVLKGGGLGVRELKSVATLLHVDEPTAALVVEVASAARLIGQGRTPEVDPAWLPTDAADVWLGKDPAERWADLAVAWLHSARLVALVRTKDQKGVTLNALSPGLSRLWAPVARQEVLQTLGEVPSDQALAAGTGGASLVARLAWLAPRRPSSRERFVASVMSEAAHLGIVAMGALAPAARALVEGEEAAPVLAPLLPAPVEQVLIQADLTAVAPGPLTTEVSRRLTLLADIESHGAATVYRFTAASIRRGLDAGWSITEVEAFLRQVSATPVPQALTYLISDVGRRFGTVRVGSARCYLRADDSATLSEILAAPGLASLGLRRLAPTVAVSDLALSTVLERLRDHGQTPAVEAPDGSLHVARPDSYRARTPTAVRPVEADATRLIAQAHNAVRVIGSGDSAESHRPRGELVTSPADIVALLREVAESAESAWLTYLDPSGRATEHVVRPVAIGAGSLSAYDQSSGAALTFLLHRIRGAALAKP